MRRHVRTAFAVAFGLCAFVFVAFAPAQPPKADEKNLIIQPGGKGAVPVDPLNKPGFIVIRPGGKGAIPTSSDPTPTSPKQPASGLTNTAKLEVPPPDTKLEADALFDFWFVAAVE